MKTIAVTVFVVLGALMASAIPAAASDLETCLADSGASQPRIAACTAAIDSGAYAGTDLQNAYFNRGNAYLFSDGDKDRAIADYSEILKAAPKNPGVLANRAFAYFQKGESNRAEADAEEAIRLDPSYPFSFMSRGLARSERGDYAGAIRDLDDVIRLKPMYSAYDTRAVLYAKSGDLDRAIADATTMIAMKPETAAGYSRRAELYELKGDHDRARADRDKVGQLSP